MARGRQTRCLSADQIRRLEAFRRSRHDGAPSGYSLPQLRAAMDLGLSWETLQKALQGLPVWDLHHSRIVSWIDRYLGKEKPAVDGKAAASGEREPEMDEDAATMGQGRSVDQQASEEAEGAAHVPGKGSVGQSDERDEKKTGATRTVRGSR